MLEVTRFSINFSITIHYQKQQSVLVCFHRAYTMVEFVTNLTMYEAEFERMMKVSEEIVVGLILDAYLE